MLSDTDSATVIRGCNPFYPPRTQRKPSFIFDLLRDPLDYHLLWHIFLDLFHLTSHKTVHPNASKNAHLKKKKGSFQIYGNIWKQYVCQFPWFLFGRASNTRAFIGLRSGSRTRALTGDRAAMDEAEAVAAVAVVTGDAARCGEVVRSTTREEPHGEATMGQVPKAVLKEQISPFTFDVQKFTKQKMLWQEFFLGGARWIFVDLVLQSGIFLRAIFLFGTWAQDRWKMMYVWMIFL